MARVTLKKIFNSSDGEIRIILNCTNNPFVDRITNVVKLIYLYYYAKQFIPDDMKFLDTIGATARASSNPGKTLYSQVQSFLGLKEENNFSDLSGVLLRELPTDLIDIINQYAKSSWRFLFDDTVFIFDHLVTQWYKSEIKDKKFIGFVDDHYLVSSNGRVKSANGFNYFLHDKHGTKVAEFEEACIAYDQPIYPITTKNECTPELDKFTKQHAFKIQHSIRKPLERYPSILAKEGYWKGEPIVTFIYDVRRRSRKYITFNKKNELEFLSDKTEPSGLSLYEISRGGWLYRINEYVDYHDEIICINIWTGLIFTRYVGKEAWEQTVLTSQNGFFYYAEEPDSVHSLRKCSSNERFSGVYAIYLDQPDKQYQTPLSVEDIVEPDGGDAFIIQGGEVINIEHAKLVNIRTGEIFEEFGVYCFSDGLTHIKLLATLDEPQDIQNDIKLSIVASIIDNRTLKVIARIPISEVQVDVKREKDLYIQT